jgi:hypothetical protein
VANTCPGCGNSQSGSLVFLTANIPTQGLLILSSGGKCPILDESDVDFTSFICMEDGGEILTEICFRRH